MITNLSQNPYINLTAGPQKTLQDVSFGLRESIFYRPNKTDAFKAESNNGLEPLPIFTPDGNVLNCYYRAPEQGKPTLMFLHGSGKTASSYARKMPEFLKEEGYGILLAEYRGFGKSTPIKPTEKTTYLDAYDAMEFLEREKNTPTSDIILWGHSMGGATAAELASKHKFKGVILDSTFTTLGDLVKHEVKGFWGKVMDFLFARNKLKTIDKIPKIESPVLIIHSKEDNIVPYQMAVRNFEELQAEHKKLVIDDNGEHFDMRWKAGPVAEFIHELESGQASPAILKSKPDLNARE